MAAAAAAAAAYPSCLTLAIAATKAHALKDADIRARLVATTVRHHCWSTPRRRLPAPHLYRANSRLPTSFSSLSSSNLSLCVLATDSDLNADPERFTSPDDYSSSYPYAGGSFEGDSSSSSSLLTERLEVTSQLTESVPSSSAEQLEEGGGGDASDGNSGDSGSGGNSGRGEGQGEDGESSKKKKIITSQKITLAYALLIAMGGTIGYLKSKSTKSLISGVGSGLALLVVYSQLPSNPVFASSLGLGISAILLFVMGSRFKNSGKIFPAGVVSIASFIMTGGYIHGIMRTSHT